MINKEAALKCLEELIAEGNEVLKTKTYYNHNNNNSGIVFLSANSSGYHIDDNKFLLWTQNINLFLDRPEFLTSYSEFKKEIEYPTNFKYTEIYLAILNSLKTNIEKNIVKLDIPLVTPLKEMIIPKNCNKIFIGHGRNQLWGIVNAMLTNEKGLETAYFGSDESTVGNTVVPILEKHLEETSFAVIVMTAEDETATGKIRARQNVIHEIGLFQGRLGFKKVAILIQNGVEKFTNIDGLQYIEFSDDKIEQTFYELGRVLEREGILNKTKVVN